MTASTKGDAVEVGAEGFEPPTLCLYGRRSEPADLSARDLLGTFGKDRICEVGAEGFEPPTLCL